MKKILVIRYGGLGDLIVTLPVLQSLKKNRYSVTLAANERYREFFLKYGWIDEFIPSDGSFFLPLFAGEREISLTEYLEKFDIILSYTNEKESFSYGLKKSFSGKIIFHPATPAKVKRHIISHLLEPVRDIADSLIEIPEIKTCFPHNRKYFVIHPGSGSIHKNWKKENFLEVYRRLSEKREGYVVLGYAEEHMKDFWYRNVPHKKIVNSPDMDILMRYISKTGLYIGNDSGISHLFAASSVTSIVIFGPTSPLLWSPRGKNVRIIYKGIDCSPCSLPERRNCEKKVCLESITVEEVTEILRR